MRVTRRSVHLAVSILAACWLAAPPTAEGDARRRIGPRPRSTMMWERIDQAAVPAQVNTHTIYLNRCTGTGCEIAQGSTNSTADPVRSSLGRGVLSPFSRGDAVWNIVVDCMREVYAPFNVDITEIDPGPAPHFEVIFGGVPQEIGMPAELGGVSPFSCAPYIPNSVVFVFDVWGDDPEELCATAAQELAHSFALDHAVEPSDPMTYFKFDGRRRYVNAQIQCGSDCDENHRSPLGVPCTGPDFQYHSCACGDGAATQNDVQVIKALFGDHAATPPQIKFITPRIGDTVVPGFAVKTEITDDVKVASADLRVNGELVHSVTRAPFTFAGPAELADGTHTLEVAAYDDQGAPGRARIQVIVGPGCDGPSDCPEDTSTCIAGRCVAGPGTLGGLGETCIAASDCKSFQCANDDGAKYCVEACERGQCPAGFGCRDDGQGGGVCWPGHSEGFAGCAATSGDPPLGAIALGLGLAAASLSRRRRRSR